MSDTRDPPELKIVPRGPLAATAAAIQERLQLVMPPRRFEFGWVPPRLTPKNWLELTRRTPFVGIGWYDISPTKSPTSQFVGVSGWKVFLVSKNVAGTKGVYLGDSQGPGIFDMIRASVAVLHGCKIHDVGAVQVTGVSNMHADEWGSDDMALAVVDLQVNLSLSLASTVTGVLEDVLQTIDIVWSWGDPPQPALNDTINTGATP